MSPPPIRALLTRRREGFVVRYKFRTRMARIYLYINVCVSICNIIIIILYNERVIETVGGHRFFCTRA